jgi:predicted nucleotidyltransferase component of viral defense system
LNTYELIAQIRNTSFDRSKLERHASDTGSGRGAIEKDFVISTLLLLLGETEELQRYKERMIFRGGTCIKKIFFPAEMRFSEDLDFGNIPLDQCRDLREVLENLLVGNDFGATTFLSTRKNYEDEMGLDFQVDYISLLRQRNHIKLNLSISEPSREAERRQVYVRPYFLDLRPRLHVMNLEEIIAEKMRALLQRTKPRDLFDVWFLIVKKENQLHRGLLVGKLEASRRAAPERREAEASTYIIEEIIARLQSLSDVDWMRELGGLTMRPRPSLEEVRTAVRPLLREVGDIYLHG